MRVGVTLPQFRDGPEAALAVASRAEAVGLDGVFVFDHLWPLGMPDRPALHGTTLLGALVAGTEGVALGPLVARVGLVPGAALVHTLATLHRMASAGGAGSRFIAGLGTGDRANQAENVAYGSPFRPAAERVAEVAASARALRELGVRTWVGGRSAAIQEAALEAADGWNGWAVTAEELAAAAARLHAVRPDLELSWAGQVRVGRTEREAEAKRERFGDRTGLVAGTVADLARHLRALADAGAAWAICAPLDIGTDESAPDLVAEAAAVAGLRGPNAVAGLRGPNAVAGLRGPSAVAGLRGPNAAGLRGPNAAGLRGPNAVA